jgi:maleate cis-trans isomerase
MCQMCREFQVHKFHTKIRRFMQLILHEKVYSDHELYFTCTSQIHILSQSFNQQLHTKFQTKKRTEAWTCRYTSYITLENHSISQYTYTCLRVFSKIHPAYTERLEQRTQKVIQIAVFWAVTRYNDVAGY